MEGESQQDMKWSRRGRVPPLMLLRQRMALLDWNRESDWRSRKRHGEQHILKASLGDLNLLPEELAPTGAYTDMCLAVVCVHSCLETCVPKFAVFSVSMWVGRAHTSRWLCAMWLCAPGSCLSICVCMIGMSL